MNREYQRSVELDPALIAAFEATFISRWDTYTIQTYDGSYRRVGRKNRETNEFIPYSLTLKHVHSHFKDYLTEHVYVDGG
jgi:hypothetical protein